MDFGGQRSCTPEPPTTYKLENPVASWVKLQGIPRAIKDIFKTYKPSGVLEYMSPKITKRPKKRPWFLSSSDFCVFFAFFSLFHPGAFFWEKFSSLSSTLLFVLDK